MMENQMSEQNEVRTCPGIKIEYTFDIKKGILMFENSFCHGL
jgi:hypothetical protein